MVLTIFSLGAPQYYIGEVRSGQRSKAFALTTTTVQLLYFTHTPEAPTAVVCRTWSYVPEKCLPHAN